MMAPSNKTLWSMEISSPTFLDVRRKVRNCVVDDYIWDMLD
jgi:hypothetical protein